MKSIFIEIGKFAWNGTVINQVIPCDSMETAQHFIKKYLKFVPTIDGLEKYKIDKKLSKNNIFTISITVRGITDESYIRINEYDVLTNADDWFVKD